MDLLTGMLAILLTGLKIFIITLSVLWIVLWVITSGKAIHIAVSGRNTVRTPPTTLRGTFLYAFESILGSAVPLALGINILYFTAINL